MLKKHKKKKKKDDRLILIIGLLVFFIIIVWGCAQTGGADNPIKLFFDDIIEFVNSLITSGSLSVQSVLGISSTTIPDKPPDGESRFIGEKECAGFDGMDLYVWGDDGWIGPERVIGECGVECLDGTKCVGEVFYKCYDNKWVMIGKIEGECGYVSPK